MKTIGLIGGMSWESTLVYYRGINELIKEKLGGLHSAKILLYSVDFAEIEKCQREGNWQEAGEIIWEAGFRLKEGGADCLLLCTNTMHKLVGTVDFYLPLINIIDVTAEKIKVAGYTKVGLLGTKFTMEEDFYKSHLAEYGIQTIIPTEAYRDIVHEVIYQELCQGIICSDSRKTFASIIRSLVNDGAEAIILGCTEIPLIVNQQEIITPLFDTTKIHIEAAVDFALGK